MATAVLLAILSLIVAVMAGVLLRNKEYPLACGFALASASCIALSALEFRTTGYGTPLKESDLKTSVIYQVIGTPVSHSEQTGWSNAGNLVFLQAAKSDPLGYHLTKIPPPRFLVIKNEKGELEFLPRPLPKKQLPPDIAKNLPDQESTTKESSKN